MHRATYYDALYSKEESRECPYLTTYVDILLNALEEEDTPGVENPPNAELEEIKADPEIEKIMKGLSNFDQSNETLKVAEKVQGMTESLKNIKKGFEQLKNTQEALQDSDMQSENALLELEKLKNAQKDLYRENQELKEKLIKFVNPRGKLVKSLIYPNERAYIVTTLHKESFLKDIESGKKAKQILKDRKSVV